jgi:hypothetical protein
MELSLEVSPDRAQQIFLCDHQKQDSNNTNTANKYVRTAPMFTYLGTVVTNQNHIHAGTKSGLILRMHPSNALRIFRLPASKHLKNVLMSFVILIN